MKINKTLAIAIGAIAAAILLLVIIANSFVSRAVSLGEKVKEARSAISVQEKRRADLLPILADAIKSYDKHEYETLVGVINARQKEDGGITDATMNEINAIIDIVVEKYPDLKSNENYSKFMTESATTENMIAETRNAYNSCVSRYNTYIKTPINSFVLSVFGYEKMEFERLSYEVSSDAPTNLFD